MPEAVVVDAPVVETPEPLIPANVVTEGTVSAPETTAASVTADPAVEAAKTEIPPEKPTEEKKTSSRFERKISRLYRDAAEQKARADLLQQQLDAAKPRESNEPGAPRADQFDDVEKYASAKADFEKTKALQEHEGRQQSAARQAQQQALVAGWEAKVAAAEAKYEDFDEVVGELKPTSPWAVALMKAENGADIAHHLGTNMKEAQRIMSLDPVDQFIEIGRLSAKLQLEPVKPKQVTKAPDPINPVSGTRTIVPNSSLEASNYKDFLRARNKELGRKVG